MVIVDLHDLLGGHHGIVEAHSHARLAAEVGGQLAAADDAARREGDGVSLGGDGLAATARSEGRCGGQRGKGLLSGNARDGGRGEDAIHKRSDCADVLCELGKQRSGHLLGEGQRGCVVVDGLRD